MDPWLGVQGWCQGLGSAAGSGAVSNPRTVIMFRKSLLTSQRDAGRTAAVRRSLEPEFASIFKSLAIKKCGPVRDRMDAHRSMNANA